MPIRMTDDPQDQQDNSSNSENRGGGGGGGFNPGGGGGGGLFQLLPLLLTLFRGKRSILLIVLIVGGYFLMNRGQGCNIGDAIQQLSTGGFLDPRQFERAPIYEPTTEDPNKNALPESADLSKFAPTPKNQGSQGSCVAWSSAYAARTILEAEKTGQNPDQLTFSPAFLYNQIGLEDCQGSYIVRAMEYLNKQGAVPFDAFPYTDQDCTRQPDGQLLKEAGQFRIQGFNRLSDGDRNNKLDFYAIKEHLAQGSPVVIGMMVGQSFMQPMQGAEVWEPTSEDAAGMSAGGHAMCVVGYDDKKFGGAFKIMNSWGTDWGQNGFGWVRYSDFNSYVREAYALEAPKPMSANLPFSAEVGLMEVVNQGTKTVAKDYIQLDNSGENVFTTSNALTSDTRFKIEIRNQQSCYIYIFGKETDGTSYTLFPYPNPEDATTTKYSPFCGITGYRLFPKDKSMQPDNIGKEDEMAIVVSKEPIDWYETNKKLSKNPGTSFAQRLKSLFPEAYGGDVRYTESGKGGIKFEGSANSSLVVALIKVQKN